MINLKMNYTTGSQIKDSMSKTIALIFIFTACMTGVHAQTLQVTKKAPFLNIPIQESAEMDTMRFYENGKLVREINIRVADDSVEYWVFADLTAYRGKEITIRYPGPRSGLDSMYLSSEIAGADSLYTEENRPGFHFTTKRGWNNDPNGLVFYDGEYHLFYQHNPYSIWWQNMHWGHAVSPDLVHWQELPTALYPDEKGVMFSGSAVIDKENTSGFRKGKEDVMVIAYTRFRQAFGDDPQSSVQCIAYSNDKGRTFTKYKENPVLDTQHKWETNDSRDPKVFWHEPTGKWVMVLFEKTSLTFYNSDDLKHWQYQSRTGGFWECPELFELPVDGDETNKKWVLTGASGTYMIGTFDGKKFTTESDKLCYIRGEFFAAQTYNNEPQNRRIQIGWARIRQYGMPFNQMMAFPTQLTLRTTREGIRLYSTPVKEIEKLHRKSRSWENLNAQEANEKLADITSPYLHIKMKVKQVDGAWFNLKRNGRMLVDYNISNNDLNGQFYGGDTIEELTFDIELLVDKTSVEIFMDQGKFSMVNQLEPDTDTSGLHFDSGGQILIEHLEVHELESIWPSAK